MKRVLLLMVAILLLPGVPAWAGTFTANGNQTVSDADTGLMWQQGEGGGVTWEGALAYCEGLSLAEYSDWRLPNFKELESLTDDTRYNPAIDTAFFPGATSVDYWSSTTSAGYTSFVWLVSFVDGYVFSSAKSFSTLVRCVR